MNSSYGLCWCGAPLTVQHALDGCGSWPPMFDAPGEQALRDADAARLDTSHAAVLGEN